MQLSDLSIVVRTEGLKEAIDNLGQLKTSIAGVTAAQKAASIVDKNTAKAKLDNAKAESTLADAILKTEKAAALSEKTTKKTTAAHEEAAAATAKRLSIEEKQASKLAFMTEGFSSGQSAILAHAKALGEDTKAIGVLLDQQRALKGTDPFDRSLGALKIFSNELEVLNKVQDLYNQNMGFTKKQMEDLGREFVRLRTQYEIQGKSLDGLEQEFNDVVVAARKVTDAENQIVASIKQSNKALAESAKANDYLENELNKVRAATDSTNAAFNRSSSNSIVRFEQALKKSGLTVDEQKKKLDEYRRGLEKLQKSGGDRQVDYISRALGPQITDIFVGLATGQAPLTVMLQQGGQLRDQFALAGIEADKMSATMRTAASSMVASVGHTAKAFGGLLLGAFIDAGNGIKNFLSSVMGIDAVTESARRRLAAMGDEGFSAIGKLNKLSSFMGGVFAASIALGVGSLITLGIATVKASNEQKMLTSTLTMQGATLGLTTASAIDLAKSMRDVGVTTSDTIAVITEMAKAGGFAKDSIELVTTAAINLQKWGGVAIADTVKTFASIGKDPVEAMIKFAKETGLLSVEQIKLVDNLIKTEGKAAGVAEAMNLMGNAHNAAAQKMKDEAGLLVRTWVGFLDILSKAKSALLDIGRTGFTEGDIAKTQARVNAAAKQMEGYAASGGTDSGGYRQALAQYKELSSELEKQIRLRDANTSSTTEANSKEAKQLEFQLKLEDELDKKIQEKTKKQVTMQQYVTNYVAKLREQGVVEGELLDKAKKVAELEWKASQKKGSSKQENFYDTLMRSAVNAGIAVEAEQVKLTKSQEEILKILSDPRWNTLSQRQQQDVLQTRYAAVALEQQAEAVKRVAEAEELRDKILGKSEGIGRNYYDQMKALEAFKQEGIYTQEQVEELTVALFKSTPAWLKYQKAVEASDEALRKFNEESLANAAENTKANQELDLRAALLGKNSDEQRLLTIEYQKAIKLAEVDVKLQKQLRDIDNSRSKASKDGALSSDQAQAYANAVTQAERDAAEQRKTINREVAMQYAEDLDKEMQRYSDAFTDVIATAMFDGGKAGSQKLKDFLKTEFKNYVIKVLIQPLVGNLIGSILGGSGGGGAGGGGIVGSLVSSALGSTVTNALGISGLTSGIITAISAGFKGATLATGLAGPTTAGAGGLMGFGNALAAGWGWAIAAIGALAAIFGKKATPHAGAASAYSAEMGLVSGKEIYASSGLADTRTYKTEVEKITSGIAQTVGQTLDTTAKTFGKTAGFEISTAFADDTSKDGAWGSLVIKYMGKEVLNWADTQVSKWAPKEFADGEEGVKQYMQAVASSMRDALMNMDLPGWANDTLKALGDSPSVENLQQVIAQINAASLALDNLKNNLVGFSQVTDEIVSALVKQFDGIENLIALSNSYYDNYYTEQEKQANLIKQLTKEFDKQNLLLPKTRSEYRKLVEAQDLATEEGRKMYAFLLQLAPAFAEISEASENAVEGIKNNIQDAFSILEETINRQIALLEKQADASQKNVDRLRAIFDLLAKNIRELYQQTEPTAAMLAAQGRQVITNARSTGVLPDINLLSDSISAVRTEIENSNYTTQFEADKARLQFAAELTDLQKITGEQLSTEELILKALKDQIEVLNATLANARAQVDAILGVQSSVLTVAEALDNLYKAMFPNTSNVDDTPSTTTATPVFGPGGGSSASEPSKYRQVVSLGTSIAYKPITDESYISHLDSLSALYHSFDGTGNLTGLLEAIRESGGTMADLSALSGYFESDWRRAASAVGIEPFADGGAFTDGIVKKPTLFNNSIMGEAGPEAILPLTNVGGKLGVSANFAAEDDSILATRVGDLEIALQMIAINTSKTNRILERVTRDGESLLVTDTATL